MTDAVDPTVLEVLRGSAFGPMLDRPVHEALHGMGLPALPQLPALPPLPDLPPLPPLDPTVLIKPAVDLAASFGNGKFPTAGGGIDPMQVLNTVASTLQQVVSLGTSALQAATSAGWAGDGATSAASKSARVQQDSVQVAAQGMQQKAILADGARVVGEGAAHMATIIAKFVNGVLAAGPFLATPPGQAFLIALATESITEATVCVAKTKVELIAKSGQMASAGQPVPVTGAPTGVDPMQMVSQAMGLVQPLIGLATTGAQVATQVVNTGAQLAGQAGHAPGGPADIAGHVPAQQGEDAGLDGGGMGGGPMGVGGVPGSYGGGGSMSGGGGGGVARSFSTSEASAGLSPWQGTRAGVAGGSAAAAEESTTVQGGQAGTAPGGMMPMGGAGAGLAARGAESVGGDRSHLVTDSHGDEVVGPIEGVSLPVVGAAENQTEPPPDKALTL
ncbi:hypothetical protein [Nocardia terpenica]|uniref:Uncharacterized protein n=1 Tax=Nocardia terpenica TaxID=455432 RepID=A0A6G9YWV4_9NOCA|nr:hypothetical protein [Nocardia terpenica]QIS17805.1 hypothetical protein F6W96_05240 [Nocardia terpenica]